jgi:putative transposase
MIEFSHVSVPLIQQCRLLSLPRSSVYYRPRASELNFELMKKLDVLYTAHPFLGYRKLTRMLVNEGCEVGQKRIRRLLRVMGLRAIYQVPNTSKSCPKNLVYPYLLRGLAITRPNQVWATDITYIRMGKGFVYLVAIMDWYSRRVLSWRLSPAMDTSFCVEALEEALYIYGIPEIFNTDQGSQFTSQVFTDTLKQAGVLISMDGRGSYHDNIFIERLWRSVKYEEIYLYDHRSLAETEQGLKRYFEFYNTVRVHQSLGYKTPEQVHFSIVENPPADMMGIPIISAGDNTNHTLIL